MPWQRLPTPDGGPSGPPAKLPELVDRVLAGLGAPTVSTLVRLHEHWAEVVGEELVSHAQLLAVEEGVLRIGVDSPAWAGHLRWLEADIVHTAARVLNSDEVRSVTVRVLRPGRG